MTKKQEVFSPWLALAVRLTITAWLMSGKIKEAAFQEFCASAKQLQGCAQNQLADFEMKSARHIVREQTFSQLARFS